MDDFLDMWDVDEARFCTFCGRRMEYVMVADIGYDQRTGQKRQHIHPRCPRQPRNGWQALWRGVHEELCGPGMVEWH